MTTLISFYTNDWKYPGYARNMKRACGNLGIAHDIRQLKTTGSYLNNCCLKPKFILDMLEEKKSPVLWVDVDAIIYKKIKEFDGSFDFAVRTMPAHRSRKWHVGTMWFNYTPAMISFMKRWIENTGDISDESALETTRAEIGHTLRVDEIPASHFQISGSNTGQYASVPIEETVILHTISKWSVKKKEMAELYPKSNPRDF